MGHESCPFPDRDCYDCSFLWLDGCVLHITEGENIFGMAYNKNFELLINFQEKY